MALGLVGVEYIKSAVMANAKMILRIISHVTPHAARRLLSTAVIIKNVMTWIRRNVAMMEMDIPVIKEKTAVMVNAAMSGKSAVMANAATLINVRTAITPPENAKYAAETLTKCVARVCSQVGAQTNVRRLSTMIVIPLTMSTALAVQTQKKAAKFGKQKSIQATRESHVLLRVVLGIVTTRYP